MKNERKPLIAANWKCNQRWTDCEEFVKELEGLQPDLFDPDIDFPVDVLVCPPFPYIAVLGSLLEEAAVFLGAQDVSPFDDGAYTGAVSAGMLDDLECDYCIVGHSERRNVFGDGDDVVGDKLARLQQTGALAVLCVGESLADREAGRAEEFTLGQLDAVLAPLRRYEADQLVVAYEPIWAIGTGRNASAADAQVMCQAIRGWLSRELGVNFANGVPVLYGGSVKPDNAAEYFRQEDVDGALVGGASLKAGSFSELVKAMAEVIEDGD